MSKYICGAVVDIGVERESQEDYVQYREFGDNLFCVVADGAGSQKGFSQPAVIVVSDILETLTEIYEENEELFLHNPEFFIKRAMLSANRVLGGFKMGNEERYYGYAASVTCCLFCQDGTFYMGHTGNTRLYILRNSMLTQMTRDQTKAAELLNDGKIDLETYHVHPDRLVITDGLGILLKPHIQTLHGKLKENDNLPSVRSLAKELKISALTVKKAYDSLENEGFTVTIHGKGTYVTATNTELLLEEQKKELESDLERIIQKGRCYGISDEDIKKLFELILEG